MRLEVLTQSAIWSVELDLLSHAWCPLYNPSKCNVYKQELQVTFACRFHARKQRFGNVDRK